MIISFVADTLRARCKSMPSSRLDELILSTPQNGIKSHGVALLQSNLDAQAQAIPSYCPNCNRVPLCGAW